MNLNLFLKKHTKQISTVFVAAMFLALTAFYACSKDEPSETTNPQEVMIMSEADLNFQNQIVKFRDKVNYIRENPDYKSGEVMDVDSAILQIETLFNASYSFADEQYGRTKTDTATILIDVTPNDEVAMDDVVDVFDEILNTVTQFYYQCPFDQKGFLLLDLKKGEVSGNKLSVGLRAITGQKTTTWEPFGEDDDWLYGDFLGRCDYTQDTTDSAEELEKAINFHKPLVAPPPGYRFIDVLDDEVKLTYEDIPNYPAPVVPPLNYLDYLIYYASDAIDTFNVGVEECLTPEEMNFYFDGQREVIYQILPIELNKPSNWVFKVCNLQGKKLYVNDEDWIMYHENNLTFAFRYLSAKIVIPPPAEL